MKILIIEKSTLLAGRIMNLLTDMGENMKLYCSHSYIETHFLLRDMTPDIVLLDISLPKQSARLIYRDILKKNKSAAFIILLSRRSVPDQEKKYYSDSIFLLDKYADSSCLVPCVKQIIQHNLKPNTNENHASACKGNG